MTLSNSFGIFGNDGVEIGGIFFLRFTLLFYAFIYFLNDKYLSIKFLLIAIIISFGVQTVDCIFQYITGYDFIKNHTLPAGGRIFAAVSNPNHLGLF
jgi:hypothetical protein